MTRRFLFAVCASAMLVVSARAQAPLSADTPRVRPTPQLASDGPVRVQSSISFFLAGPTGDIETAVALREKASRIIFQAAAAECTVLKEVLARECRLDSVNSTVNGAQGRAYNAQQPDGFTINGQMSYQILLK